MDRDPHSATDDDSLATFFRMSLDLCCIARLDGSLERVNAAFAILGWSEEELLSTPFLDLVHPDDRERTRTELAKLARGVPSTHFENRYRCKDGAYLWFAWTTAPSSSGVLFAMGRNVTDSKLRRDAERRELERQRHQYQAIFDTLPQMIWLKAADDTLIRVNAAAARSIGLTPSEAEGRRTAELYPAHAGRYRIDDLEVIERGMPKLDIVEPYEVAPGDVRWVRTDKTPYFDAEGNIVGVVVSATEVTGWKRSEEERARLYEQLKAQDELKTRFFANVSHELRTPLTLIIGPVEKLLRAGDLDATTLRELEVVARNARTLLKRVNDLLDVARLDAGKLGLRPAQVDLVALVRAATAQYESIAADRRIDLVVEAPAEQPLAQVDPDKTRQIVDNLLANAFKFTPAGGTVRCTLRAEPPNDAQPQGLVTIEVADSGPGVEPAMRELIFERFRHAGDFGGTGLGLAIARELVMLHGGRIFASAASEGGALFSVELPLLAPAGVRVVEASTHAPRSRATEAPEVAPPSSEPREIASPDAEPDDRPLVLVVEDNEDMSQFIAGELSPDYRIARAFDGEQGLEAARTLAPDLVLTDVMMPRVDGLTLLAALRADASLSAVPVVLLTARADEESMVDAFAGGADDYLAKPFSARELRARVRAHLELVATRAEATRREEEAARLRTAVRARDEFLSVASHELRTPLSALQLNLQLLERLPQDAVRMRSERLDVALRACKNLGALIETLLDVGRAATGHLELNAVEMDLAELLHDVARRFEPAIAGAGCSLELRVEPTLLGRWDRLRLDQVFANLLGNAIKFGAGKPIELTAIAADGKVHVSVRDHGVGIAPPDQARIFQRFEQVASAPSYGGLGLGLWVSNEIVRRHGGSLTVESRLGEGSTFRVSLPRARRGDR
ncbi:MAG: PAS domain S-box protein [Labilithrix sp.]|nr:PAS domain S-box protein [Labilithrix sp.]